MNIELHEIPVREIFDGYHDDGVGGVYGYGGRLNIRPAFQREFIYSPAQSAKVIESLRKDFPLNVMYWVRNHDGGFEMLDGQQRTISICQYLKDDWSVNGYLFGGLLDEEKEQILNYKLMIYICEGTEREKLDWFETINIAGEKLTAQERRNALYSGSWLKSAKEYFSRPTCAAKQEAEKYLSGSPIRQDYLETAIYWAADNAGIPGKRQEMVTEYMSRHQRDKDCGEMWQYFMKVINWVKFTFHVRPKVMTRVEWGLLYNLYGDEKLNPDETEERIKLLMEDFDVTDKAGIYQYIFDGDEKHLHIRKFPERDKQAAYERQGGNCARCGKHFAIEEMEADHRLAWSKGGHTEPENCQMLCRKCNREKGNA